MTNVVPRLRNHLPEANQAIERVLMSRNSRPRVFGLGIFALTLVLIMACTTSNETEDTATAGATPRLQATIALFESLPTPIPSPIPTADRSESMAVPTPAPAPTPVPSSVNNTTLPAIPSSGGTPDVVFIDDPDQYLLLNQRIIEGLSSFDLDITNVNEVFKHIFNRLPDEVTVYPSENYYYFVLYAEERQFWGNIRLPAGARDDGELSFAYFEFEEFPVGARSGITRSKFFNEPDGVFVRQVEPYAYNVEFEGKTVKFRFHELRQDRPQSFPLGPGETFIQRTFDESGIQFFLLFNRVQNYFFWVLNEEEIVPDTLNLLPGHDDVLLAKKSGFAFYVDEAHGNRKVLSAIRRLSVNRNDYYDGPFDQLADNYADETGVSEFMQRAYPGLRNRIDKFGYYLDQTRPLRVAISTYYTYLSSADLNQFMVRMKAASDPYFFASRGGLVPTPIPAIPTVIPTAVPTETPPTATPEPTPVPAPTAEPTAESTPEPTAVSAA
jgi:hypothetical protein